MFINTQSELNKASETPSEGASAELHISKAIDRFYYRKNTTNDVKKHMAVQCFVLLKT